MHLPAPGIETSRPGIAFEHIRAQRRTARDSSLDGCFILHRSEKHPPRREEKPPEIRCQTSLGDS
jgi:hypothetical protein